MVFTAASLSGVSISSASLSSFFQASELLVSTSWLSGLSEGCADPARSRASSREQNCQM